MLFLFKNVLGAILLAAPLLTQRMGREAYLTESLQIGMDNSAIILGRADRRTLQFVQAQNKRIAVVELLHDTAHVCARATAVPNCVIQDALLETSIRSLFSITESVTRDLWMGAQKQANQKLKGIDSGFRISRRDPFPFHQRRCPVCGLGIALDPIESHLGTSVNGGGKGVVPSQFRVRIEAKLSHGRWNYALRD